MVLVTKADGTKQEFDRSKIVKTCLRLNVSEAHANEIADRVQGRLYEGITTKKVLQMVFTFVRKYRPELRHRIDLRHAISIMRSKPDFEEFVRFVLREHGYEVEPNKILQGRCVEHEIDGVASKEGNVFCVEVKHHEEYHTYTGLHVFLETYATLQDLMEGKALNGRTFNRLMVVCNTKVSDHARRYAECRGITHVGWNYPERMNLSEMIDSKLLYPITILRGMDSYTQGRLGDNNIVALKQLAEADIDNLVKMGISRERAEDLVSKARGILGAKETAPLAVR